MTFQSILQILFYMMFLPALISGILISINNVRLNKIGVRLVYFTTLFLILSQILLAYLLATLNTDFQIVTSTSASWMSIWQLIGASWTNRWGSYHLWTLVTWIFTSLIFQKYYKTDKSSDEFFKILIWGSIFILFLLMGQRPYRLSDSQVLVGLTPSLLSIWNILHPPLAFTSYTGYYLSWVIGSYLWIFSKEMDEFSEKMLQLDIVITRITLVLNSTMIIMGIIWSHESTWGGYWQWDSVQTLAVVLWLISAYKLHIHKREKDRPLFIFLSLIGFTIVFFAAYIITSNILVGLHSYAPSPIAFLFLVLILLTIIPIIYGFVKNKWSIISPVRVDSEKDDTLITGFNIGVLSFNLLLLGNIFLILVQIIGVVFSLDIINPLAFPILNGTGFLGITIGILYDELRKIKFTRNNIYYGMVVLFALSIWFSTMEYLFNPKITQGYQLFFIIIIILTIVIILVNLISNITIRTTKQHLSHIAMFLILLTIISNGAGATVDSRDQFVLSEGDYTKTSYEDISFTLEKIVSIDNSRGNLVSVVILLQWRDNLYNLTIELITQDFYPMFVEPVIKILPNGLEVFFTLFPGDPFIYLGPNIIGVGIVMELYTMTLSLYFGLVIYLLIPFIPNRQLKIFSI